MQGASVVRLTPAGLYGTQRQGLLYLDAYRSSGYHEAVVKPLDQMEARVADCAAEVMDRERVGTVVDLGPGDTAETLVRIGVLRARLAAIRNYIAVDLNHMLASDAAVAVADHFPDLRTRALVAEFERLTSANFGRSGPVLFLLGSTFMNYRPRRVCELMRRIGRPGDGLAAVSMLRPDGDASALVCPYENLAMRRFLFEPLRQFGIRRQAVQYAPNFAMGEVRLDWVVTQDSDALFTHRRRTVLLPGTRVRVAISRRPRLAALERWLADAFWRSDLSTDGGNRAAAFVAVM